MWCVVHGQNFSNVEVSIRCFFPNTLCSSLCQFSIVKNFHLSSTFVNVSLLIDVRFSGPGSCNHLHPNSGYGKRTFGRVAVVCLVSPTNTFLHVHEHLNALGNRDTQLGRFINVTGIVNIRTRVCMRETGDRAFLSIGVLMIMYQLC